MKKKTIGLTCACAFAFAFLAFFPWGSAFAASFDDLYQLDWSSNAGGTDDDQFNAVIATDDGYVAVGHSYSDDTGWDQVGAGSVYRAVIVKYNLDGTVAWAKAFGAGDGNDGFDSVVATGDGYVAVGSVSVDDPYAGINNDALVVKFGLDGTLVWEKTFGGSGNDEFRSVTAESDGFVAVGASNSGDALWTYWGDGYSTSAIIVKFDSDGNVVWENSIGGTGGDAFWSVATTISGYVAVGDSSSDDAGWGNNGSDDALIATFDSSGTLVVANTVGGSDRDVFASVVATNDGFVAAGFTTSTDAADWSINGYLNALIVKFDSTGNLVWANTAGGTDIDLFSSVASTGDGYIVAGQSLSEDADAWGNSGSAFSYPAADAIVAKFGLDGSFVWGKNIGGLSNDGFYSVATTADGFVAVGSSLMSAAGLWGNNGNGYSDAIIVAYSLLPQSPGNGGGGTPPSLIPPAGDPLKGTAILLVSTTLAAGMLLAGLKLKRNPAKKR